MRGYLVMSKSFHHCYLIHYSRQWCSIFNFRNQKNVSVKKENSNKDVSHCKLLPSSVMRALALDTNGPTSLCCILALSFRSAPSKADKAKQHHVRGLWLERHESTKVGPTTALLRPARTSVSQFSIQDYIQNSLWYIHTFTALHNQYFNIKYYAWNNTWREDSQFNTTVKEKGNFNSKEKKESTCTEDPRNQTAYNHTAHLVVFLDVFHRVKHLKDSLDDMS